MSYTCPFWTSLNGLTEYCDATPSDYGFAYNGVTTTTFDSGCNYAFFNSRPSFTTIVMAGGGAVVVNSLTVGQQVSVSTKLSIGDIIGTISGSIDGISLNPLGVEWTVDAVYKLQVTSVTVYVPGVFVGVVMSPVVDPTSYLKIYADSINAPTTGSNGAYASAGSHYTDGTLIWQGTIDNSTDACSVATYISGVSDGNWNVVSTFTPTYVNAAYFKHSATTAKVRFNSNLDRTTFAITGLAQYAYLI